MKRILGALALLVALFLLPGVSGAASAAASAPFPVETLSFAQLEALVAANKGKVVMINFFATWCPPCREEIPSLIRLRKEFGEDKLVLIGASVDEDGKALKEYMQKTKFNYPIRKAAQDLVQAAGVSGIPHMLVFDGKGEVIANAAGLVPENDLRNFLKQHMESK